MHYECIIVIPAYNEEACIARVLGEWTTELKAHFQERFRIIVIDDGSKDTTPEILDGLAKTNARLMVVHQANQGHGTSVMHGYEKALEFNSDYIFQTDSDDQFEARDFMTLWERRTQSDFILGYREIRNDAFHRLLISKITSFIIFAFFLVWIKDSNVPYRLMKTTFLREILPTIPARTFIPNIFLSITAEKRGQELLHIPVRHKTRQTGKASIVKWSLIKACGRSAGQLFHFWLST